jgi:hypothetical protein
VQHIEKLFPKAGPSFLLQMLYNCQKVSLKDKFFYDALLSRLEEHLPGILSSTDLSILGLALSMNPDLRRDNLPFLLKFYEHAYTCRFLLKQEDKTVLSRLFGEMGLAKANKKHLDLFQGVNAKEASKQALKAYGIEPPENIMIDFDVENRVVIMKNKKTKQMIIVFGSEHNCEQSIGFGKQLMDTFKPKTLFLEDSPLEERIQDLYTDENGFTYPAVNKVIDRLNGP